MRPLPSSSKPLGPIMTRGRRNSKASNMKVWADGRSYLLHSQQMTDVQSLIEDFTNRLAAALEGQAMERARHAVESAFGVKRPGRPPKVLPIAAGKKPRKIAPRQLCPVPGCKNPAAPVFGMVCAKHKDVAKAKIKKYREARKAKKLGIKMVKAPKRRAKKVVRPKAVAAIKPAKTSKRRAKKLARPKAVGPAKPAAAPTPAT
jgi:hypothetical protein